MKLKHHESKLLRKVDFLQWKTDNSLREAAVMRRYHVTGREDYIKYNKLVGMVTSTVAKLKASLPRVAWRERSFSRRNSLSRVTRFSLSRERERERERERTPPSRLDVEE